LFPAVGAFQQAAKIRAVKGARVEIFSVSRLRQKKYYPSLDCAGRRGGFFHTSITHQYIFYGAYRAGEEKNLNTNVYQYTQNITAPDFPPLKVVERKIGRSTFIVSSRFNTKKEKDIITTIARLVQYDNGKERTSGQVDPMLSK